MPCLMLFSGSRRRFSGASASGTDSGSGGHRGVHRANAQPLVDLGIVGHNVHVAPGAAPAAAQPQPQSRSGSPPGARRVQHSGSRATLHHVRLPPRRPAAPDGEFANPELAPEGDAPPQPWPSRPVRGDRLPHERLAKHGLLALRPAAGQASRCRRAGFGRGIRLWHLISEGHEGKEGGRSGTNHRSSS